MSGVIPSDHYPMIAEVKVNFKADKKIKNDQSPFTIAMFADMGRGTDDDAETMLFWEGSWPRAPCRLLEGGKDDPPLYSVTQSGRAARVAVQKLRFFRISVII